jgi:AcrR family transcriptional regulator
MAKTDGTDALLLEEAVPGTGGTRSEPTRLAILAAARATFAARGYEQTTIRTVAAQAGIDASMVIRYFGSKAGLFAAAATRHLQVPDLRPVPADERGEYLVRHFIERWENGPVDDTLVFLLRTAVTNEAVANEMQSRLHELVVVPISALDIPDAENRGAIIGTQLLGIALTRYVLHLEPIATTPAADIIARVGPAIQLLLLDSAP